MENQINIKLRYMLASTDEEFKKLVNNIIRKRHRFQSAVMTEDTTHPQTVIAEDVTTQQT